VLVALVGRELAWRRWYQGQDQPGEPGRVDAARPALSRRPAWHSDAPQV